MRAADERGEWESWGELDAGRIAGSATKEGPAVGVTNADVGGDGAMWCRSGIDVRAVILQGLGEGADNVSHTASKGSGRC
jgi:hypothetical protein